MARAARIGGVNRLPGCVGFNRSNTANLRKMLVKGTRGRLICIGDSTYVGQGSNGSALANSARTNATLAKLVTLLNQRGVVPANYGSFCGNGWVSGSSAVSDMLAIDSRITVNNSADFDILTIVPTLGSFMIQTSTVGDTLTFTPGVTFNQIEVGYFAGTSVGQGAFAVSVDGGTTALTTVDCTIPAEGHAIATVSCPAGSTAATLKLTGGTMYIQSIATRDTTKPGIEVYNGGMSGGSLKQFSAAKDSGDITTFSEPEQICAALVANDPTIPHVFLFNGWGNDLLGDSATAATCVTYQTSLINFLRGLGSNVDVIYENYSALGTATISAANQATYRDALIANAVKLGVPVIDFSQMIRDQASWNTAGYFYDDLHLNGVGQAYKAENFYLRLLKQLQAGVF